MARGSWVRVVAVTTCVRLERNLSPTRRGLGSCRQPEPLARAASRGTVFLEGLSNWFSSLFHVAWGGIRPSARRERAAPESDTGMLLTGCGISQYCRGCRGLTRTRPGALGVSERPAVVSSIGSLGSARSPLEGPASAQTPLLVLRGSGWPGCILAGERRLNPGSIARSPGSAARRGALPSRHVQQHVRFILVWAFQ